MLDQNGPGDYGGSWGNRGIKVQSDFLHLLLHSAGQVALATYPFQDPGSGNKQNLGRGVSIHTFRFFFWKLQKCSQFLVKQKYFVQFAP